MPTLKNICFKRSSNSILEPDYHRELNPHAPKLNDTIMSNDIMIQLMMFLLVNYINEPISSFPLIPSS